MTDQIEIKFLSNAGEEFNSATDVWVGSCSAGGDPFVQRSKKAYCPILKEEVNLVAGGQCQEFECNKNTRSFAYNSQKE